MWGLVFQVLSGGIPRGERQYYFLCDVGIGLVWLVSEERYA